MSKSSREFLRLQEQSLEKEQSKYLDDSFHYGKRNTGTPKRNPQTNKLR
tara:strand:+ start:1068 stop:1214 length:147 start_codon:yes stop_codon:yes gene_type:complete